jgi:hypothetical protein
MVDSPLSIDLANVHSAHYYTLIIREGFVAKTGFLLACSTTNKHRLSFPLDIREGRKGELNAMDMAPTRKRCQIPVPRGSVKRFSALSFTRQA